MDNDLERSVRFLEDAVQTPTRGLFKLSTSTSLSATPKIPALSFEVSPETLRNFGSSQYAMKDTMSLLRDVSNISGLMLQNQTQNPWISTVDNLSMEFGDILQGCTGGLQMLETVEDFARCCSDALAVIKTLKQQINIGEIPEEIWLENERNNWRLLFILFNNRLNSGIEEDNDTEFIDLSGSEKNCIKALYKKDALIRECQLVVDWLERNASDRDDPILHHSDWSYGWEHTLHQLVTPETIAIGSNVDMIKNIHIDAPHYQNLSLHHLDQSNDNVLSERIFAEIRCGNLEGAQELCVQNGQAWRASMLEGWKPYHNENRENEINKSDIRVNEFEGNEIRDLWKCNSLEFCKEKCINVYERASVAVFSGYLDVLLSVCKTWEDYLWAYLRTMIDIKVESELRDNMIRKYEPLPEFYWNQKMSLDQIFQTLDNIHNTTILEEARQIEHIIQKLLILDDIPKLMSFLEKWSEDSNTPTYCLRFFTHLVIFFESVGQTNRKLTEKIIESYINRLSGLNITQLVALYVSKVGKRKQITLYAKHCEKIIDNLDRQGALDYAEEYNLDVSAITVRIVESIINRPTENDFSKTVQRLTEMDETKISSLDWLLFFEQQRVEALKQTNTLIFKFLTMDKLDAAQLAINKIPHDSIESIKNQQNIESANIDQIIKTYLSYKAYLDAHEAFNSWFKQVRGKPMEPAGLPENAQFTEKVAHKHKLSQFQAETERWKLTTSHSAKIAKTLLYNVLLFPEGWLQGAEDASFMRAKCIPEIVFLLYSVLSESNSHEEAIQLADVVGLERFGLYHAFSNQNMAILLEKICESSVALLNAKKDPFGNPTVA